MKGWAIRPILLGRMAITGCPGPSDDIFFAAPRSLTPTLKTVDPAFGCRPDVSRTGNPAVESRLHDTAAGRGAGADCDCPVDFRHGNDKDSRAAHAEAL